MTDPNQPDMETSATPVHSQGWLDYELGVQYDPTRDKKWQNGWINHWLEEKHRLNGRPLKVA